MALLIAYCMCLSFHKITNQFWVYPTPGRIPSIKQIIIVPKAVPIHPSINQTILQLGYTIFLQNLSFLSGKALVYWRIDQAHHVWLKGWWSVVCIKNISAAAAAGIARILQLSSSCQIRWHSLSRYAIKQSITVQISPPANLGRMLCWTHFLWLQHTVQ